MSGFSSQNRKACLDLHLATGRGTASCWRDFVWTAESARWITHGTVCKSLCCFLPCPRMELKTIYTGQEQAGSMHLVHSTCWHAECLQINPWSRLSSSWHCTDSRVQLAPRVTVPSNSHSLMAKYLSLLPNFKVTEWKWRISCLWKPYRNRFRITFRSISVACIALHRASHLHFAITVQRNNHVSFLTPP